MKYSAHRYFDGHWHIFGQETNLNAYTPFMWIRECILEGMKEHSVEPIELSKSDIAFLTSRWADITIKEIK